MTHIKNIQVVIRIIFASILFLATTNTMADSISAPEDRIKAAYIFQFIQFTTWPDTSEFQGPYFNICVLGKESINEPLKLLHSRQIGGKQIKVIFLQDLNDSNTCKILYITKSKKHDLNNILAYLQKMPVLSVSSIDGFAKDGGIIGFVSINNKVRLQINRSNTHSNDIRISAKLLEVASMIFNEIPGIER